MISQDDAFDVFLAHNGSDAAAVEYIANKLIQVGLKPWLDSKDIMAGEPFKRRMAQGIAMSRSCAIFLGPHGMGKWEREEIDLALSRAADDDDYRLIPVFLPGMLSGLDDDVMVSYLRGRSRVDFRSGLDDQVAFDRLVRTISTPATALPPPPPPDPRERKPRVPDPPIDQPIVTAGYVSDLGANLDALQGHISNHTFTPVIGHGCSLVGRTRGRAWREIASEINEVIERLSDDERGVQYLRSLAAAGAYDVPLDHHFAEHPVECSDEVLIRFQLRLAQLGAQMGDAFASAMLQCSAAIWSSTSFRITLPKDDPRMLNVFSLLIETCVAAMAVRESADRGENALGLGAVALYERLIELTGYMTQGLAAVDIELYSMRLAEEPAFQTVLDDIRDWKPGRHLQPNRHGDDVEISISNLEWIADALWHTFRFNKSAYPRADEFAFQISLLLTGLHAHRIDLITAAELGKVMLSAGTLASWFRSFRTSEPPARLLEFYDALAAILHDQHRAYLDHVSESDPDSSSDLRGFQAVAFSTTFDLELELALSRIDDLPAFHIVVPVHAYRPGKARPPDLRWLLGTVQHRNSVETPFWAWFPEKSLPKPKSVKGPIIIRLHGSPLHELPMDPDELQPLDPQVPEPEYERFEHALVLSEREYLQNIVWRDPTPKLVDTVLLQTGRSIFFLGHSLDEWNTRLRLFSHVYRGGAPPANADRIAISQEHDPHRSAVLRSIGIHRWIGDLENIADATRAVLSQHSGSSTAAWRG